MEGELWSRLSIRYEVLFRGLLSSKRSGLIKPTKLWPGPSAQTQNRQVSFMEPRTTVTVGTGRSAEPRSIRSAPLSMCLDRDWMTNVSEQFRPAVSGSDMFKYGAKKKRRDNEWNQIPRTEPLSHRSAAARLTFLVTGVKDSANISCSCCHAGVYSQCQCCCRWTTDRLTTDVYSSNFCWSLSFFYCFKCFLSWDSFWFPSGLSAQTSDLWSGRWSLSLQTTSVVVQDRQISRSLKTHSGFLLF